MDRESKARRESCVERMVEAGKRGVVVRAKLSARTARNRLLLVLHLFVDRTRQV